VQAYERVQKARGAARPTALSLINAVFTGFFELHGDRVFADDRAVVGGLAQLDGAPVTVIGLEKGSSVKDKVERNFGAAHPEGYRKALRLMKQAEKFGRPVVTIVDTAGAYCGIGAEERGQGRAIAVNLMEMMRLKTPVISIVLGEGGSGGALALAVADEVWLFENSVYSVISPEGAASILYKDPAKAAEAADSLRLTAGDLASFGLIDRVFSEHNDNFERAFMDVKKELRVTLRKLCGLNKEELLELRWRKFRAMGET
jgi:acetyl-CoA carboxylase carboxyl transferase subunit alpha